MQKVLLVLLVSCYQGSWIPILNPGIKYTVMERLPIMMHNIIRTHSKHHVGLVVDTYFSHERICVHLCRTIDYGLFLISVTIQALPLTTLEILLVLPIPLGRSYAKNVYTAQQTTCTRILVNGFAYRLFHKCYFPYLMAGLFHMYDVWN